MTGPAARVSSVLQGVSAAALGVLFGAAIMEGAVLVTWWRSIPPAEFLAWYAANAGRLLGFFGPVTTVAMLASVAAAIGCMATRRPGRVHAVVAAALTVLVVVGFFVYFDGVNARFAAGTIPLDDVPAALAGWATWHWVRVGVLALAFAAALWSLETHGAE